MKKIKFIILLFVSIFTINLAFAQVDISMEYNGNDVTNSTMTLKKEVEMHIDVTNTGLTDMDVTIEITAITIPHKAPTVYTCWNVCTYPTGPINLGSVNIGAGQTNSTNFHVTYIPDGSTDPANITFHAYETGNSAQYITLYMDTEHVGVNDLRRNNNFTLFPNPANDKVTIKLNEDLRGYSYRMSNILGKEILSSAFERNTVSVELNDFSKGIYFVSIYRSNNLLETKKLIVK